MDGRGELAPGGEKIWDRPWTTSFGIGLTLFLIYLANGRMIGAGDTEPTKLVAISILRGDGPFLDRFDDLLKTPTGYPYFVTRARGHIVSNYPVATAILALPFDWPQVAYLDLVHPGWEREAPDAYITLIGKNTHALLGAILGVAIFHLLRRLGLGPVALPTVAIVCLGSSLWSVASQAPWQHGPAALALTLTALLLSSAEVTRRRLLLAGLTAGAMAAFRPIDVVLSFTVFLWVLRHHRRGIVWFSAFPALLAVGLLAYNYGCFGDVRGGYAGMQGKDGSTFAQCWDTDLVAGALGTLASPARGLLVYTPWIAVALLGLPFFARRIEGRSLASWLLWALVPYCVLLSKYRWWTAGWSFGPRYWTDVLPLFAILLGFGLDWARERSRGFLGAYALSGAAAVAIHLVGVFYFPSSWNSWPTNSDADRARLWDWRDSELTRCLDEGAHPARFRPWSADALKSAMGAPRDHQEPPVALGRANTPGRR